MPDTTIPAPPPTIPTEPPTEPALKWHREVSVMMAELGMPHRLRYRDRAALQGVMLQEGLVA